MFFILISLLILSTSLTIGLIKYRAKYHSAIGIHENLQKLEVYVQDLTVQKDLAELLLSDAIKEKLDLEAEQKEIENAIQVIKVKAESAESLAEKELEIKRAEKKEAFKRQLEKELEQLKQEDPITKYQEELERVNAALRDAKNSLEVWQDWSAEERTKEEFIEHHSITLTPQDREDIQLIRDFQTRFSRKEALSKLIWTEYIQRPIQALCKRLNSEGVRGIYSITHIESGRMYIGQAVNISNRWKDHCKVGLGIGSNNYLTNKFYKALYSEGIENFTFEILEEGDIDLNERERYWIRFFNAVNFGYNSKEG